MRVSEKNKCYRLVDGEKKKVKNKRATKVARSLTSTLCSDLFENPFVLSACLEVFIAKHGINWKSLKHASGNERRVPSSRIDTGHKPGVVTVRCIV